MKCCMPRYFGVTTAKILKTEQVNLAFYVTHFYSNLLRDSASLFFICETVYYASLQRMHDCTQWWMA